MSCCAVTDSYHIIISAASVSADEILSRAAIFQASANQHHLNQPTTRNKGLELAEAARIKAKITSLQKQGKADVITVEATLFYYPKNGTAAKKVMIISYIYTLTDHCVCRLSFYLTTRSILVVILQSLS